METRKAGKRGERSQRLAFILFFSFLEDMRISHLYQKADEGHPEIKADLEILLERRFVVKIMKDHEVWYSTTEEGVKWTRTQFKQYEAMYGAPYITRPPGLLTEDAKRTLRYFIRTGRKLRTYGLGLGVLWFS